MLTQTIIMDYLKQHKAEFTSKYSIEKIGLFGSFVKSIT